MPRVFFTKIVGVTHENADGSKRQAVIGVRRVGEPVSLVREPDNIHDANAIAVLCSAGFQLGYLSEDVAAGLAETIDAGNAVTARISDITGGTLEKPTRGANLEITVYGKNESGEIIAAEALWPQIRLAGNLIVETSVGVRLQADSSAIDPLLEQFIDFYSKRGPLPTMLRWARSKEVGSLFRIWCDIKAAPTERHNEKIRFAEPIQCIGLIGKNSKRCRKATDHPSATCLTHRFAETIFDVPIVLE